MICLLIYMINNEHDMPIHRKKRLRHYLPLRWYDDSTHYLLLRDAEMPRRRQDIILRRATIIYATHYIARMPPLRQEACTKRKHQMKMILFIINTK